MYISIVGVYKIYSYARDCPVKRIADVNINIQMIMNRMDLASGFVSQYYQPSNPGGLIFFFLFFFRSSIDLGARFA
jgi:hypothetical protein